MTRRLLQRADTRFLCLLGVLAALSGCGGGSPTPPTTTSTTTTTTSTSSVVGLAVTGASGQSAPGQTTQLTATATMSDGTNQNVTSQATWDSSNAAIATVSNAGLVTAVAAGDADIRASYRSLNSSARISVAPAAKPRHRLSGVLTDQINGRGVEQARVDVTNGTNAGRTTTTATDGTYSFSDLIEDSFTIRFSSPFYEAAERSVTLSSDARMDVVMKPNADVSPFYGKYIVSLSIRQQNCEFPVTPAATAELTLSGSKDGTTFNATIFERDNLRSYGGRMGTDGTFSGNGGGLIVGLRGLLKSPTYGHDYTGSIEGRVSGRSVTGNENVTFAAPCPGKFLQIGFSGSK
jgi:hypothetical protein